MGTWMTIQMKLTFVDLCIDHLQSDQHFHVIVALLASRNIQMLVGLGLNSKLTLSYMSLNCVGSGLVQLTMHVDC